MRLHYLQHVPFEDLANIESWAKERGHDVTSTLLFENEKPPSIRDFDWLVVMGGPMNIYEEDKYPWLADEKRFIREAIDEGKPMLGICLGAQLIADVLGGKVRKNEHKEIGWHSVVLTPEAEMLPAFRGFPFMFTAFHWHGDTFEIPPGAIRLAVSKGCANQGFQYGNAIGLQFHLESSMDSIDHLIHNCGDELVEGSFIQKPDEILGGIDNLPGMNRLMELMLDNIERKI